MSTEASVLIGDLCLSSFEKAASILNTDKPLLIVGPELLWIATVIRDKFDVTIIVTPKLFASNAAWLLVNTLSGESVIGLI